MIFTAFPRNIGACMGAQGFGGSMSPCFIAPARAGGNAGSSNPPRLQNPGLSLTYKVTVGLEWGVFTVASREVLVEAPHLQLQLETLGAGMRPAPPPAPSSSHFPGGCACPCSDPPGGREAAVDADVVHTLPHPRRGWSQAHKELLLSSAHPIHLEPTIPGCRG